MHQLDAQGGIGGHVVHGVPHPCDGDAPRGVVRAEIDDISVKYGAQEAVFHGDLVAAVDQGVKLFGITAENVVIALRVDSGLLRAELQGVGGGKSPLPDLHSPGEKALHVASQPDLFEAGQIIQIRGEHGQLPVGLLPSLLIFCLVVEGIIETHTAAEGRVGDGTDHHVLQHRKQRRALLRIGLAQVFRNRLQIHQVIARVGCSHGKGPGADPGTCQRNIVAADVVRRDAEEGLDGGLQISGA